MTGVKLARILGKSRPFSVHNWCELRQDCAKMSGVGPSSAGQNSDGLRRDETLGARTRLRPMEAHVIPCLGSRLKLDAIARANDASASGVHTAVMGRALSAYDGSRS